MLSSYCWDIFRNHPNDYKNENTDRKRYRNILRTKSATVELCSKAPSGLTCDIPGLSGASHAHVAVLKNVG